MAYAKMKPCPYCENADLDVYTYDSGWRHVECTTSCGYLGPGEGNIRQAIRSHNDIRDERRAEYLEAMRKKDAGRRALDQGGGEP
ncbi:hypothetical protein [Chelatococcus reniformis]|uniref:Restriction alleviation protein, Lar family n=1 Tax=Chelatococcus reniformis TaxID=1494448 RepID=A0A916XPY6_9HYPH|nr:hypothetical protein [Chelatococcus reniformis]GGC90796.1 hypothetical protein GCM10010994_55740 [Chelatococcus reniformis]